MKTLLSKTYRNEAIADLDGDVWEAVESDELPADELGFFKGRVKVTVIYFPDDE